MKFSEKVRIARKTLKMTQSELAQKIGLTVRSVVSYEAGTTYPRTMAAYEALAAALGVSVNYLRTEDEEFSEEVRAQFGSRAQRQAATLLGEAHRLFAGGELSEEEQLAFITEMQQLFLDSKRRAKKFAAKKAKNAT